MHLEGPIRPIVSRITIHWPSFYNVVTGKTLALPNLIALQHIPLSPAGVIAKRPAPIALPNSCAAYTYGSLRFTPIKERAVIVCLWMYRVILLTRRGDGW